MTEQEIKQTIDASDHQIKAAYQNLRSAARTVGTRGCEAAKNAREIAVQEASATKTKNTLLPLLLSVFGLFIFGASVFWGLAFLIGGIVIAYNLNQKADAQLRKVRSEHDSMVSMAESQRNNLNTILDNNATI